MILTKLSVLSTNLRQKIKIIWLQDKILLVFFLVSFFLNLAFYLFLVALARPTSEPVVLHYTVYFGFDLIGEWYRFYFMPTVGTFLFLVNFFVTLKFYQPERMAGYLLSSLTLVVEFLLLIGGILVLLINY